MAVYINCDGAEGVETVDEFDTYKEAQEMLREYKTAGEGNGVLRYYISSRCTKEWRNSYKEAVTG